MMRALVLLCGLLAAVITAELRYGSDGDGSAGDKITGTVRAAPQAAAHDTQPEGSPDQLVAAVLARPLFSPDRRPAHGPAAGVGAADPALPRLAGIISSSIEAVAIFQGTAGTKPVVARHGETVDGWTVMTIAVGQVILRKANNQITVTPQFDGVHGSGAVMASSKVIANVKQPQSRWEAAAISGILPARWSNPQLQP
jgi:hypothetical protein